MHLAIAVPSIAIAFAVNAGLLSFWLVVAFGIAISGLQAVSDPARQSMLSRVTRTDIQRTVTLMTIVTSLAGLAGVWLGGQLDRVGLFVILLLQGLLFAIGADAVRRLPPMPVAPSRGRPDLLGGIKATWRHPLIRSIITLNFLSSLFNAGAYIIAIPFIVKDVYGGDAAMFAAIIMVFTAGSIGSNVILLRFMPLLRPGRSVLVDAADPRAHFCRAVVQAAGMAFLYRDDRVGIEHGRDDDARADDRAGTRRPRAPRPDPLGIARQLHDFRAGQLDGARQVDRRIRPVDGTPARHRDVDPDLRDGRGSRWFVAIRSADVTYCGGMTLRLRRRGSR